MKEILGRGESPEQRQEEENKLGNDIGVKVMLNYFRDLETLLKSLDFISVQ